MKVSQNQANAALEACNLALAQSRLMAERLCDQSEEVSELLRTITVMELQLEATRSAMEAG